jgi:hypothetical protein
MKTSKLVEWSLKHHPETRNSDIELILNCWHEEGLNLSHQQIQFIKTHCSNPESIRRLRQKIQQENRYLPDQAVEQARYEKSVDMRQASQSNIDDMEQSLNWKPEAISWQED